MKLPDLSMSISNKPVILSSNHCDNVGRAIIGRVNNDLLLDWCNRNLKEIASLSVIDILEFPPLNIPVTAGGDEELFLLIENYDLDETLVKRRLGLLIEHQMGFDEVSVPKNESAVLSTAEDLPVGEFADTGDVRELELAEFSNFSLELESSECLCHLPEADVARAAGEQDIISKGRKSNFVDLLGEGLCLKNNFLIDPFPHGDGKIWVATDTSQLLA